MTKTALSPASPRASSSICAEAADDSGAVGEIELTVGNGIALLTAVPKANTIEEALRNYYNIFVEHSRINGVTDEKAFFSTTGTYCGHDAWSGCDKCDARNVSAKLQEEGLLDFTYGSGAWTCYGFVVLGLKYVFGENLYYNKGLGVYWRDHG